MDVENYIKDVLVKKGFDVSHSYRKTGSYYEIESLAKVYFTEPTFNGEIFKDEMAYKFTLDDVCYIPENNYGEYFDDVKIIINEYEGGKISARNFLDGLNELSFLHGYTRKELLNLTNEQKEVADIVFDGISWENPEVYRDTLVDFRELDEYRNVLVLTEGIVLNEYLYELYKKDWCNLRGFQYEKNKEIDFEGSTYVCFDEFVANELEEDTIMLPLIQEDRLKKAYPELSVCKDFEQLVDNLDNDTLLCMENTIYLYENTDKILKLEDGSLTTEEEVEISFRAISWYEGLETTEDLLDGFKPMILIDEPEMEI